LGNVAALIYAYEDKGAGIGAMTTTGRRLRLPPLQRFTS
jgi:hypothetical protein